MATITTRQGDTWDILAKRAYGNELFMDVLIKANINHRKTVIFPAGVVLELPEIDTTSTEYEANLPVWKRTGGD
jgi:phage tail protein X